MFQKVSGKTLPELAKKVEKKRKEGYTTISSGGVMKEGDKFVVIMAKV